MGATRPSHRPSRLGRLAPAARSLLLFPIPTASGSIRLVDMVVLPVAVVVAMIVCIPILTVTFVVAAGLGSLLESLGVPAGLAEGVTLVVGLGSGLVLGFLVMLRISRRLPASVRTFVYEEDAATAEPAPVAGGDPAADATSLAERLTAADAALAPAPPGTEAQDETT